jgi:MFS family permease
MAAGQEREMQGRESSRGGVWSPGRRRLTFGLVLSVTVVAFEALAVATILPVVSRHLGDLRLYGWVFSAFLLASLLGIVIAGSLADRIPLTRPMLFGLGLFAIGLLIGGTAADMPVLVVGRAVQGFGAGVVPSTAYVAISRAYPEKARPRMFAVLSTAWVVPGLIGPAVAALVASAVGWRWVFLGLIPLVIVAGFLGAVSLRAVPPPAHPRTDPVPYLPAFGIVGGAGIALASLSSGSPLLIVIGVLAGGSLLAVALRRLTPEGTLLARPGLPATIASRGLLTFCFYAGDAYVPYALTTVRHAPTVLAGLALTGGTMTWTAGSWVQERRVHIWGPRVLVRAGECCVVVALLLMALCLLPAVPPAFGVLAWSVAGAGMGLAYAPMSVTTLDLAPPGREGKATSGLQLTDVLGQAVGTGAGGAAVAFGAHGLGARDGVALAFAIGIGLGLTALSVHFRIPARLKGATEQPVV